MHKMNSGVWRGEATSPVLQADNSQRKGEIPLLVSNFPDRPLLWKSYESLSFFDHIFFFFMDCNEDLKFSSEVAGANSLKQNCNFGWLNNGTIAPRLLLPHQDRRSNPIMHLGCIFVRWSPNNKSPEIDQLRTTYQVVGPARTASEDLGPGMIVGR